MSKQIMEDGMNEHRILITLRHAHWQRAKAELLSILNTYWSHSGDEFKQWEELDQKINRFIKNLQENYFD